MTTQQIHKTNMSTHFELLYNTNLSTQLHNTSFLVAQFLDYHASLALRPHGCCNICIITL